MTEEEYEAAFNEREAELEKKLEKELADLSTGKQFAFALSSGESIETAFGSFTFKLTEYLNENGDDSVDKINIIIHHSSPANRDRWRYKHVSKFKSVMKRFFGFPMEIKELMN